MDTLLSQLINGLSTGSTYALVALGVVLIFSVLDVLSLAQGEIFLLSAYFGFVWVLGLSGNLILATAAVLVGSLVIGAFVEQIAIRPALSGGHMATLITTVGVGIVFTNLVIIVFGPFSHVVPNDAFVVPWHIGAATIRPIDVIALVTLLVGFAAMRWTIFHTRIGVAVRATAENPDVAAIFGIRVQAARTLTFVIGSGFAGLAAVILSLKYGTLTPALGIDVTIKALTVAVIGGAGRLEGAVIAAFGLGIAESLTTAYLGADMSALVGYSLLLVCIILLPEGLFRRSVRRAG